jgi:hypothetical protein
LVNDEMLTSLREEVDHSMEHQFGFVGAQDQNDVSGVQFFGDRLDPHPGLLFDRGCHAPADDVDRDREPLSEDQPDGLWMQVHGVPSIRHGRTISSGSVPFLEIDCRPGSIRHTDAGEHLW